MALFDGFFSAVLSRLRTFTQKKVLALVCSVCGILLFLPDRFLDKLHLVGIRDNYGQWLGLAFLVSGLMFGYKCVATFFLWNKTRMMFQGKGALKRIDELNEVSLGYLFGLYYTDGQTWNFDITDGNIVILIRQKMVGVASNGRGQNFDCFLLPWVVRFFDNHHDYLDSCEKRLLVNGKTVRDLLPTTRRMMLAGL